VKLRKFSSRPAVYAAWLLIILLGDLASLQRGQNSEMIPQTHP
jgi:hypothetical protein